MKTNDTVRFTRVSRGWRAEIWGPFNMNRCTLKASGIGATQPEARRVARERYRARGAYLVYRRWRNRRRG